MNDAETTKPNGAPPKRGDAPREWPNTVAAAAQTGLNRKQLNKYAERGVLAVAKDSMGVWRWDPDMLAVVAEARGGDDDDDDSEAPNVLGTNGQQRAAMSAEAVALLKQAHTHQEQTLRLVLEPQQRLLDRYAQDNADLRERVKELEATQDKLIAAREKMLTEQHLRDQLERELTAREARKDKALQVATDNLPKLLAAINPKADAVVKLVQSLTAEQRDMLLLTELLTPEQRETVRALLPPAPAPEPEKQDK